MKYLDMSKVGETINVNRVYSIDELIHCGEYCYSYKCSFGGLKYFLKEYIIHRNLSPGYPFFFRNQELLIPRLKALGDKTETIIDHFEIEDRYYQLKDWIEGQDLEQIQTMKTERI